MDDDKWIYEDLTESIIGCCYRVHNRLGSGHKESVYQKALSEELSQGGIEHEREVHLKVKYRKKVAGTYRADFVVEGKIILEIKAVSSMPKQYEAQLVHYLKSTGFSLGLLINFGARSVQIRRRIWTVS